MGKWNHENNGRLQFWTSSHLRRIHWEIFKGKRRNTKKFEAWKSGETRKRLSHLKNKCESLSDQVEGMTNKTETTRRSPSLFNWKSSAESSEEDADSDPAEVWVQEDLSEIVDYRNQQHSSHYKERKKRRNSTSWSSEENGGRQTTFR